MNAWNSTISRKTPLRRAPVHRDYHGAYVTKKPRKPVKKQSKSQARRLPARLEDGQAKS